MSRVPHGRLLSVDKHEGGDTTTLSLRQVVAKSAPGAGRRSPTHGLPVRPRRRSAA